MSQQTDDQSKSPPKLMSALFDRRKSIIGRFREGLMSPARGADFLLRRPKLLPYAAAPFALSFGLLSALLWVSIYYMFVPFHQWIVDSLGLGGWLLTILNVILWPVAIVLYFIFAGFAFGALSNLLAGPFNDRLSLRTEELATQKTESEVLTIAEAIRQFGRTILMELKKIGFFLVLQFIVLLVWVIPVVGAAIHAVLATIVTLWFLAAEFLDYPMERRKTSYRMRLLFCWNNRYEIFGFGSGVALCLFIPVVGFFSLPFAVVGGTLLYLTICEEI